MIIKHICQPACQPRVNQSCKPKNARNPYKRWFFTLKSCNLYTETEIYKNLYFNLYFLINHGLHGNWFTNHCKAL